jgi:propionyl-CoA carboxylase alpha chain
MSFDTLLVANRGEIARRIIRSAHAMGIRCVAVYVDSDADAPFVRDADEAVRLETSYLDAAAILEAARATGAAAVHPGYGFLSENAAFAAQVGDAGLVWVGPSPDAIEQMGDKIAAKALAEKAQVPTLSGSLDPRAADQIGYPLLVKAAAGGGGKGMRVVESADSLDESIAAAKREALGGFGDDRVFIERYVARARHIEFQILGDAHGNLVHLGERECSIQRRHQKIIEESPSPRVDADLRETMGEAALRLARELGYQSAGTVEFLLDDDSGEFFFLEVNTRLQVEDRHRSGARAAAHRCRHGPWLRAARHPLQRLGDRSSAVRRGSCKRFPAGHRHARGVHTGRSAGGALGFGCDTRFRHRNRL